MVLYSRRVKPVWEWQGVFIPLARVVLALGIQSYQVIAVLSSRHFKAEDQPSPQLKNNKQQVWFQTVPLCSHMFGFQKETCIFYTRPGVRGSSFLPRRIQRQPRGFSCLAM